MDVKYWYERELWNYGVMVDTSIPERYLPFIYKKK